MNLNTLCEEAVFLCKQTTEGRTGWGISDFLRKLAKLPELGWTATVEDTCIHLKREGSPHVHSPLTAVYCRFTGEELHRGSCIHPEITAKFGLPWYDILEIAYAETCCDSNGHRYDEKLRKRMLHALKLPSD